MLRTEPCPRAATCLWDAFALARRRCADLCLTTWWCLASTAAVFGASVACTMYIIGALVCAMGSAYKRHCSWRTKPCFVVACVALACSACRQRADATPILISSTVVLGVLYGWHVHWLSLRRVISATITLYLANTSASLVAACFCAWAAFFYPSFPKDGIDAEAHKGGLVSARTGPRVCPNGNAPAPARGGRLEVCQLRFHKSRG